MRSYQDISSAKSTYSQNSSDKSNILGLPPGYMVGAEVSVIDNVLSVGPLIANISGRQVAIPKTKLLNEMVWEVPRISNFDYYIYLDAYSIYHVTNLEPVTSDSQYGKYHPIIPNWRYVCKFNIDSDGNISYVISWNAVGSTQIDVGAILARSINADTLNAIFAQFTNIIITTSGFAGYHLAGILPAIGDSRLILTGDKLALEWVTALGSPNTIDNATWVEVIRFGGRDQFNQLGSVTAKILANPGADFASIPDGEPFPILTGNAESFRFADWDSVSGVETLDQTNMTLDASEQFVGTKSANPDLGDVAHAETADTPIDLAKPFTLSARFRYGSADEDIPYIKAKNASYELGVNLACPYPTIWRQIQDAPGTMTYAGVTQIGDKMYVAYAGSLYEYNMSTDTWTAKTGNGRGLYPNTICAVGSLVYCYTPTSELNYFDVYNPSTDSWSAVPSWSSNFGNTGKTMVAIGNSIYFFGGVYGSTYNNTLNEYNTVTDSWTVPTAGSTARARHSAVAINSKMYVYGGSTTGGGYLDDIWEYDPSTDSWSEKTSGSIGARMFSQVIAYNGLMYVYGGLGGLPTIYLSDLHTYDPVTDSWVHKTDSSVGRYGGVFGSYNGHIYFGDGATSTGQVVDMWDYYVTSDDADHALLNKLFPEIYTTDPTNGAVSHTRLLVPLTASGWPCLSLTYDPATHVARIVMNNTDYCEYTLLGDEIPTGDADFQIGDDSTTQLVEVYFDDAMYFSGYAWPKSDLFTHYTDGLYWSGEKGIASDNDLLLVPKSTGEVKVIGDLEITGTTKISGPIQQTLTDLSSASTDYDLQIGETAIINFTDETSVSLHIATGDGTQYEMAIDTPDDYTGNGYGVDVNYLMPNNTTYANFYIQAENYRETSSSYTPTWGVATRTSFPIGVGGNNGKIWISNRTASKKIESHCIYNAAAIPKAPVAVYDANVGWRDNTTVWSSLGTVVFATTCSGSIRVKRTQ